MKETIKKILILITELGFPFTIISSIWFKIIRKVGIGKITDSVFMKLGVLPIEDHYYQPMINPKRHLKKSLREDRNLPGLDLNIKDQLSLLSKFNYNEELLEFPLEKYDKLGFHYNNGSYESGDAEYLYNMIRSFKPTRIIEIGSGHSTLMAQNAIKRNKNENPNYSCDHICIEPYEMPWLKNINVKLKRELVENIETNYFQILGENDILFIDSSHIIRPQGDVLFEFLEILPTLNFGVIVHVHDIFTPKDYLDNWIKNEHRLWNEQYLLEAFLSCNNEFKIIGALNYLSHNHKKEFEEKCPIFSKQKDREPGGFWIKKTIANNI